MPLIKQDWNKVLEINQKISPWTLPVEKENNRKYTTALAAENIGLEARALPLWQELAANESIPLYQRAYAQYFIARDAEKKQNLRGAYQANLDALAMFEDLRSMQSPYSSMERERESIAAPHGHHRNCGQIHRIHGMAEPLPQLCFQYIDRLCRFAAS